MRIVKCAALFVRISDTSFRKLELDKNQHIQFGPFVYKVIDFNPEKVLKLFAEHADKLIYFESYKAPEPKLLQRLINGEKNKKFKFTQ